MKNFSEIENTLVTSKDSLVESFSVESGLPKELVTKLYENYSLQGFSPKSMFSSLLQNVKFDFTTVLNILLDIFKKQSKDTIYNMVMNLLNQTAENNTVAFFKVIMYLLFLKDKINFAEIAKDMNIDEKLLHFADEKTKKLFESEDYQKQYKFKSLCESLGLNPEVMNKENDVPFVLGINDGCDMKSDLQFYTDLRTILARNNKRWGDNYHLDNVYKTICNYVNRQIEELTNREYIYTNDAKFEDTLIKQLITGDLNVMYRDVNILRPLVADLQTLNFDLMCLIMSFFKQHGYECRFVARKTFDEFIEAFRNLYEKLQTSRKVSKVLVPYQTPNNTTPVEDCSSPQPNVNVLEILENVFIDTSKYDLYMQPLKVQAVVDMLYIMKSCSFDFSLQIRPYLRQFITKGFELTGKIEHIIYELGKTNKYKNGI